MVPALEVYEPDGAVCTQGRIERGEERAFSHGGEEQGIGFRMAPSRQAARVHGTGQRACVIGIDDIKRNREQITFMIADSANTTESKL